MFNLFPLYAIVRRDAVVIASFLLSRHRGETIEDAALLANRSAAVLSNFLTPKEYPHESR